MNTDQTPDRVKTGDVSSPAPPRFLNPLSFLICVLLCSFVAVLSAADLESRQLTHYVPQDALEAAVRKEGWTEVPLAVKGGVRKGDVVRIWAGGSIDRGNGEQPGANVNGPAGLGKGGGAGFALSSDAAHAFALLLKS